MNEYFSSFPPKVGHSHGHLSGQIKQRTTLSTQLAILRREGQVAVLDGSKLTEENDRREKNTIPAIVMT